MSKKEIVKRNKRFDDVKDIVTNAARFILSSVDAVAEAPGVAFLGFVKALEGFKSDKGMEFEDFAKYMTIYEAKKVKKFLLDIKKSKKVYYFPDDDLQSIPSNSDIEQENVWLEVDERLSQDGKHLLDLIIREEGMKDIVDLFAKKEMVFDKYSRSYGRVWRRELKNQCTIWEEWTQQRYDEAFREVKNLYRAISA